MLPIELLAPARNLDCGIEAIRHGADAVYIGASRFGARAAAGNSVEDIAELTAFAHQFGAKIYVTVNTLLRDDELAAVDRLIDELIAAGVDALIVQDPRLMPLARGRIPLHSSTQMDNRTVEDVQARAAAGYEQTVLARELSLDEIRTIHEAVPDMRLEAFVHGALCVCYSGRCYASKFCFGRSANRGECAQFCRMPFDLVDDNGNAIVAKPSSGDGRGQGRPLLQRHLLSLRDMNRAAELEAMMDAGVSSFKIEGRLKDVAYVKNVTAFYRQRIDAILARRPHDFVRSSYGLSHVSFEPDLNKSFNRRFTDYFLHGRTQNLACLSTPKAIGEHVGSVKDIHPGRSLAIAGTASFANGDGLCFFDTEQRLQGFRVNRVDEHGRIYPADPSVLHMMRKGLAVYRNLDAAFERQLSRPSADRRVSVSWTITDEPATGFTLTLVSEDGRSVALMFDCPHELARTPQEANLRRQLSRLGDTVYSADESAIEVDFSGNWFIPSSVLTAWRRELTGKLDTLSHNNRQKNKVTAEQHIGESARPIGDEPIGGQPLMTCRYCLRYELGQCLMGKNKPGEHRDIGLDHDTRLALRLADGRTFPLRFDCRRCEMMVLRPE
ncbi:MAG: U32 family peptidase [Bacteroidaceae bacterium]|nr:U32 family peptidase [Bacteroidaceae bacterium]